MSERCERRWNDDEAQKEVRVTGVREKIRGSRLRWYGHVKRKNEDELTRWAP